jgi:hypothetical protein
VLPTIGRLFVVFLCDLQLLKAKHYRLNKGQYGKENGNCIPIVSLFLFHASQQVATSMKLINSKNKLDGIL